MYSRWGPRVRAHLLTLLLLPTMTTPLSVAQASPPHQKSLHYRENAHVAAVACQVTAAARPLRTRTRCRVEAIRETPTDYVSGFARRHCLQSRVSSSRGSEVRLLKDGTGAVLTRIPEQ